MGKINTGVGLTLIALVAFLGVGVYAPLYAKSR